MSENSTTPGPVERWRRSFTAFSNGDTDAAMSLWGADRVWDLSPMGLGVYGGLAAILDFWQDWVRLRWVGGRGRGAPQPRQTE
jgi:hypothetical protein